MLDRLLDGQHLTEAEAGQLLAALTAAELAPAMAGALLAALRAKGVTAAELRGFAAMMRTLARHPQLPARSAMRSTSSAPAGIAPAASICPPVRRCWPRPAGCR